MKITEGRAISIAITRLSFEILSDNETLRADVWFESNNEGFEILGDHRRKDFPVETYTIEKILQKEIPYFLSW